MNVLLHHGLQSQAQARPDADALVFGDTRLSYGDFERASNQLAHRLADLGCRHGDRVALLSPKCPAALVAMFATLKLGAIHVPLDPACSVARLALMLASSQCGFVLAAGKVADLLDRALKAAMLNRQPLIGWLDEQPGSTVDRRPGFDLSALADSPTTPPRGRCADTDTALILFTASTTGPARGVTITHRNLVSELRWAIAYFGITATDRLSQHAPLASYLCILDIHAALWTGAESHLVPAELNLMPHKLAQFIRTSELTQWFSVPSVLHRMASFDLVRHGDFASLRRVLFAGEVLPTPTLMHWMDRLPHATFSNLYGTTETTLAGTCHTLVAAPANRRDPIPIGTACAGAQILLLDDRLQPVPDDEIGHLYIGGARLSPRYWHDPEKTRSAFLPMPGSEPSGLRIHKTGDLARRGADGLLYFVGRADTQIVRHGHRIALGEIDAALQTLASLREAAAVAIDSADVDDPLICCAYVPTPQGPASVEALRQSLAQLLPDEMLPARWMHLDTLPLNASGKIDRQLLKQSFRLAEAHRITLQQAHTADEACAARHAIGQPHPEHRERPGARELSHEFIRSAPMARVHRVTLCLTGPAAGRLRWRRRVSNRFCGRRTLAGGWQRQQCRGNSASTAHPCLRPTGDHRTRRRARRPNGRCRPF
jgi:amino acid adenylation domain-containing protein